MKTMKALIFLAITILMTACQFPDDFFDDNPNNGGYDINKDITGNWSWVQSSGGFAGQTYYQESYPHVMMLNFDGVRFTIYKDWQIVQSGTYKIEFMFSEQFNEKCYVMNTFTEYIDPEFSIFFTFMDNIPVKVKIKNDNLSLVYPCCDMFDSIFKRSPGIIRY